MASQEVGSLPCSIVRTLFTSDSEMGREEVEMEDLTLERCGFLHSLGMVE